MRNEISSAKWLKRNGVFVALALAYVIVVVVLLNPRASGLFREYSIVIVGTLIAIAFSVYVRDTVQERALNRLKLKEYKELKLGETHPVFYRRITKFVTIKNHRGNADIDYHMEAKNTSEDIIQQLVHEVHHDGSLESVYAYTDEEEATTEHEKFIMKKVDNGEILPSLANLLKIKFDLREKTIPSGRNFSYGYTLTYSEIFKDMFKQDFTGQRIMHPTAILVMSLESPRGIQFVEKHVEVVDKHEVRDYREERRCEQSFPPKIAHAGKRILWEVPEPKIACTYKLHFKVAKK